MVDKTLSERTFSASAWVLTNRILTRIFDLLTLIVLARLLDPSDFGLVMIAMIFIVVIEAILDLPIFQILVRENEIEDEMFNTAFTLSLIRGLFITIIIVGLSIPVMYFYDDKRLLPLMLFISLAPTFRGLVNPRMAIFMKALDFRQDFVMNVASKIISLFSSCFVAYLTKSYWAIAVATVTTPISMVVISYILSPRLQKLSLSKWSMFRDTIGWFTISRVVSSINWQLDRILLGKYVSSTAFGAYSLASNISVLPSQVFIQPLAFPMMASLVKKKDDNNALGNAYCKSLNSIFMVSAPCFLILALLSEHVVNIILGDKWSRSGDIIFWLSLCGFFTILTSMFQPLMLVLDKTKNILIAMVYELTIRFPTMIFGIIYYGIKGAIISHAISRMVLVIVAWIIVRNEIGVSLREQMLSFWRPFFSLIPTYISLTYLTSLVDATVVDARYVFLIIGICITSIIVYLIMIFTLWKLSKEPNSVEAFMLRKLKDLIKLQ